MALDKIRLLVNKIRRLNESNKNGKNNSKLNNLYEELNMEKKSAITKDEFIKLLQEHNDQENRLDILSSIGIEIFSSDIIEYGARMFERLIESYFTEEGANWVFWWLYEKDEDLETKAWDENHNEIPMETMEDLWNYVKQYLK